MPHPAQEEARRLAAEGRLEEAAEAWRVICATNPGDGPASAAFGRALYRLGEKRFLVEADFEAGFPALCESLHRWAPVWFDDRGGGEATLRRRARSALERWGGMRRAAQPEPLDLYLVGLADLAERWAPWLGRFDRHRAVAELPELRRRAETAGDAKLALEHVAAEVLAGNPEAAVAALGRWRQRWSRPPIGIVLDDWERFLALLAAGDGAWEELDLADWREAGFRPWEAATWSARFRSPFQAAPWWRAGFAPSTAERWSAAGVALDAVAAWRSSGIEAETTGEWAALEITAEEAGTWRRAGIDPALASSWRRAGFGATEVSRLQNNVWHRFAPAEAGRWHAAGFGVEEILRWIEEGVSDPEKAARARTDRRRPADVAEAIEPELLARWRAAGLDRTDFAFWGELDLEPEEVGQWKTHGFESTTAAPWIVEGLSPEVARRWAAHGVEPSLASTLERDAVPPVHRDLFVDDLRRRQWKESGLDWSLAARWARRGHDPTLARRWHELGVDDPLLAERLTSSGLDPDRGAQWHASGLSAPEWPNWKRNGFDPEDARAWRAAGFDNTEAHRLRKGGLEPGEAKRWREAGVPAIRVETWLRAGFETEDALVRRAAGLDDRILASLVAAGARDVPRWLDAGFPPGDDLATWSRSGSWDPEEAFRWWQRFHRPTSAREARRTGLRPEDIPWDRLDPTTWPERLGRNDEELTEDLENWFDGQWAGAFASFEDATPWLRQRVFEGGAQALAWSREGFGPEEAAGWVRLEFFDPGRALDAKAEGRTLEELESERG